MNLNIKKLLRSLDGWSVLSFLMIPTPPALPASAYHSALYGPNVYVAPPRWIRYTLERWTWEDNSEERYAGETYAHTDCAYCHTLYGAFRIGEYIVDDSQSIDFWHTFCAPKHVRYLAVLGTLVCSLRAIMSIDTAYRKPV